MKISIKSNPSTMTVGVTTRPPSLTWRVHHFFRGKSILYWLGAGQSVEWVVELAQKLLLFKRETTMVSN